MLIKVDCMLVIPKRELEAILDQIVEECRSKQPTALWNVLAAWRAKLEKPPTSQAAFQIDQIMREVQARLARAR